MSSSEFKFIVIEIPKNITLDFIQNLKKSIKNISVEKAQIINGLLDLDISNIEIDNLSEEDLFNIGKESLKIKKAVHFYLERAADLVLLPRINIANRKGTPINDRGFAYLELENSLYVISGDQINYYGSKTNDVYNYLLALNLSGILNNN